MSLPAFAQGAIAADSRRIEVVVEGRASAAPDMATITLGVTAEAESAEAAVAEMSQSAQAVIDRLSEQGIAARDLQTSALSLSPRWRGEYGSRDEPREIVGYVAETTVTARVRALDSLGAVLDAAVGSGANVFRGLSFGLSEPQPVQDAARRAAVAEAQRRAGLFADAAGVSLGPLVRLEDTGGGQPRPMMRAEMAMSDAGAVPVAEGELDVTARVRMVWKIAPE
ncbi:DUF541 domain-containing protein [Rhodovulum sp. 12E13]|nr:DUF541 domain-containing protein [Rhodovulum sp. 12E13]